METTDSKVSNEKIANRLNELGFDIKSFKDDMEQHKSDLTGNPSVYCGTYGKYNEGSIEGQWIDLSTFDDFDDFYNYCCAIHADEEDPELMFQDYECFPEEYYDECLGRDDFDKIQKYIELCDSNKQEAVDAWLSITCGDDIDKFEEAYMGEWDSEEAFAESLADDCGYLSQIPENLRYYFDFSAFARDLFAYDYDYEDGFVFLR